MRISTISQLIAATTLIAAASANARPEAPLAFCAEYPEAPACQGTIATCAMCHAGPPNFNAFGGYVAGGLAAAGFDATVDGSEDAFLAALPEALRSQETFDSDGDGVTNLEEIMIGTLPGSEYSFYEAKVRDGTIVNDTYDLDNWDAKFALKRTMITYCGHSPSYDDVQELSNASDARQFVHDTLDSCLQSDFWKNEALHRLADIRIRPLKAVGRDGDIILADYDWDYRLFSYVLSDDHDARELLTADYHVDVDGEVVTGEIDRDADGAFPPNGEDAILIGSGQPLRADRRAGMITTQWFFVVNTMFSEMPRTTAAQAYRAYLGQDIARGEGIHPVAGEPRDVDNKGVTNPTCAACHSTLDPLAYAFSAYEGIMIQPVAQVLFGSNNSGTFSNNRTDWTQDGSLFGQPVGDVVDWANQAVETDEFKRNLADMFFEQALGREPYGNEQEEFKALWVSLPGDNYSANRLIHRLVDTDAFGAP